MMATTREHAPAAVLREGVTPGALWYFRMVSRDHANQTFHGQHAPTGWFVSPITFVMTR